MRVEYVEEKAEHSAKFQSHQSHTVYLKTNIRNDAPTSKCTVHVLKSFKVRTFHKNRKYPHLEIRLERSGSMIHRK